MTNLGTSFVVLCLGVVWTLLGVSEGEALQDITITFSQRCDKTCAT